VVGRLGRELGGLEGDYYLLKVVEAEVDAGEGRWLATKKKSTNTVRTKRGDRVKSQR